MEQRSASPVARWLTKSYLRSSVVWSLLFGLNLTGMLLIGGAPADAAIGLGVFAIVVLGLGFAWTRLWGRWRHRDPRDG